MPSATIPTPSARPLPERRSRPDPERFATERRAEVVGVDGARHLRVGEAAVRRVLDEIDSHVLPDADKEPR